MSLAVLGAIASERRGVVGTVFRVRGSSPARLGQRMLVRPDGSLVGTIGGGEMEYRCMQRVRTLSGPEVMRFDLFYRKAEGLDLACGGAVEILLEPLTAEAVLVYAEAERLMRQRTPFVMAVRPGGVAVVTREQVWGDPSLVEGARRRLSEEASAWEQGALYEYVRPRPHVLLVGAGHINAAVARLLVDLEYFYSVVDDRPGWAERIRGARERRSFKDFQNLADYSHVVICTHSQELDFQAVLSVCRAQFQGYVGLIGSRAKRADFWQKLKAAGVPESMLERIEIPMGQPIGAESVAEIAVSIVASLIKTRDWTESRGGSLKRG